MADVLSTSSVDDWTGAHPQWQRHDDAIRRSVEADSFPEGIDLVRRVAELAEQRQHHPDIDIRYRTVTFTLSTHSAGGLTSADLELAEAIDTLG